MGGVLFSTLALVSPFLQQVAGYPVMAAGLLLAARGGGTLIAMTCVGAILFYVEARTLIIAGLGADGLHAVGHDVLHQRHRRR